MNIGYLACCGIKELANIGGQTPEAIIHYFKGSGVRAAFGVFSQVKNSPYGAYGDNLVAYIRKHKLGTVRASSEARNPNSGNIIKMWIVKWNHEKLETWTKETKK